MRKFILYFLLFLLVLAVGFFSYGFWNGKKIQSFAGQLAEIQAKHDLAPRIDKIEAGFRDNGKKEISQIREESKQFSAELETVTNEASATKKEIENLSAPGSSASAKKAAEDYFARLASQSSDLKEIIGYMSQIIEVAAVFGEMGENATLGDMKGIIARAEEKGDAVRTVDLPQNIQADARNLKESMNAFLAKMEEIASQKSDDTAALDESYADFSKKEDEFFAASRKYIDGMENLDVLEEKIQKDVERLGKVRFSFR